MGWQDAPVVEEEERKPRWLSAPVLEESPRTEESSTPEVQAAKPITAMETPGAMWQQGREPGFERLQFNIQPPSAEETAAMELHKTAVARSLERAAPEKYGKRGEQEYESFAAEVAKDVGRKKTPEFVKAAKAYLDAADWSANLPSLPERLPPKELRPFILSAAEETARRKWEKTNWAERTLALSLDPLVENIRAINQLVPGDAQEKAWNEALIQATQRPEFFAHPDQGFISRNAQSLLAMLPGLAVAGKMGPAGVPLMFGVPKGLQVERVAEAGGATPAAAATAGVAAGITESLLFSKRVQGILGQLGGREAAKRSWEQIIANEVKEVGKTAGVLTGAQFQGRVAEKAALWASDKAGPEAGGVIEEAIRGLPDTLFQASLLHVPGAVRDVAGVGSPWERSERLRKLEKLRPLQQQARLQSKEFTEQWVGENSEAARQLAQFDQPSRSQWQEAGLPEGTSERFRRNFVGRVRGLLPELPAPAGEPGPEVPSGPPTAPEPRQPGLEGVVEPPGTPPEFQKGLAAAQPSPTAMEGTPGAPEGPQDVTSLKNRVLEPLREERGAGPPEKPRAKTQDEMTAEAQARIAADPTYPARLARDLNEKPRPVQGEEFEALQIEQRRLYNELARAAETGDEGAGKAIQGELDVLEKAAGPAKTYWHEAGMALQRERLADFSFAEVTRRAREAKGADLSADELAEVVRTTREIAEREAASKLADAAAREDALTKALEEAKAGRTKAEQWRTRSEAQRAAWGGKMEASRREGQLAERLGVQPEELHGLAEEMAREKGSAVKAYNDALDAAAETTGITSKEAASRQNKMLDVSEHKGLDETAPMVAREHPDLGLDENDPDVAEKLGNLIAAGHKYEVQWADMLDAAAERIAKDKGRPTQPAEGVGDAWEAEGQAGGFPWEQPAPAAERPTPTGPAPTAREKAAREPRKAADQAAKERVRERKQAAWANLKRAISETAKGTTPTAGGIPIEVVNAGIELVRAYVDEGVTNFGIFMRKAAKELGEDVRQMEDRLRAAWQRVREDAPDLQNLAEPKELAKYAKARAAEAVARRIEGTGELLQAVHQDLAAIRPGITEEQVVDALRGRGEFGLRKKALTPEQVAARYAEAQAKAKVERMIRETEWNARTPLSKLLGTTPDILNASRAILTSMDFSAVLRQGMLVTLSHPDMTIRALPDMFKAFFSRKAEFAAAENIRERSGAKPGSGILDPNKSLYEEAGLPITDTEGSLERMEEAYMGHWLKHVPEWMQKTALRKALTTPLRAGIEGVAGSERAYITFLNRVRADLFDSMVGTLGKSGTITLEEAKAIANYVGVVTGRGSLGGFQKYGPALATVFFSPRFVASRFEYLLGQPLWQGTARTRGLVAKEYGRVLVGLGTMYGSLMMAKYLLGLDDDTLRISFDPRSSDFAKPTFGNTRVDPLAGLSQTTVFLTRSGASLGRFAGLPIPKHRTETPWFHAKFLAQKLSPALASATEVLAGENIVGQPVTPRSLVGRNLVPISFQDIYDAMQSQGAPKASAFGLLGIFGLGVQTYGPKTKEERQLSDIYNLRNQFLESKGKGRQESYPASPIRPMREAAINGDFEAFRAAKKEYLASGKKWTNFRQSLQSIDPIHTQLNDADEREFKNKYLSPDDRAKLDAVQTYARELRHQMAEWWNVAK